MEELNELFAKQFLAVPLLHFAFQITSYYIRVSTAGDAFSSSCSFLLCIVQALTCPALA